MKDFIIIILIPIMFVFLSFQLSQSRQALLCADSNYHN